MKKHLILTAALLGVSIAGFAADSKATAKADTYPLTTCVVSDEKLGGHGDYITYTHKEAGKPDRAIRLCCDGCIDDFKKEPAKFLAKLDAAAKATAPGKKPAKSAN